MEGMLDQEWIKLILQAKHLGLTIEEIRKFLYKEQESKTKKTMNLSVGNTQKSRV
ncbi:hypothetical protein BAZO_00550 [Schinkia azotoformans LMG 9581]|uniref:Sin domain-containing protein n=2 Tax=Schinkia azotoformans TaxID=1454 RepID=K6ECG1_SCHAZ|nr:hypothetical protein BAZO_00550 [Schinkia azotoformans LMG 9581]